MTTIMLRIVLILIVLLQIPLTGEVFAQEEVEKTASTSNSKAEQSSDKWYKSERISGEIQLGDFVVGPGRSEIELAPGESKTIEISVTNRISDDRLFEFIVEDITGSKDGASLVAVKEGEVSPYSIVDYISFPESSVELELGERARIPVTITVPADAEPGGHYGSIFISTIRKGEAATDAAPQPTSPIIARIGSLVFLTIKGEVERSGQTLGVDVVDNGQWWFEEGPIDLGITYENTGSVHTNPYGEISISNMLGEEVGFVELEPWFVLPKAIRNREVTWDREFLFGRYTIEARVNRGYDDIVDTVTTSFWVLPWKIVGGTFAILFIIIFGLRAFFRTFEFKRKEN